MAIDEEYCEAKFGLISALTESTTSEGTWTKFNNIRKHFKI